MESSFSSYKLVQKSRTVKAFKNPIPSPTARNGSLDMRQPKMSSVFWLFRISIMYQIAKIEYLTPKSL